jgi:hypothetical protein
VVQFISTVVVHITSKQPKEKTREKRLILTTAALVASLLLAPAARAQERMEEKMGDSMTMEEKMEEPMMEKGKVMEEPKMMEKGKMKEMPKAGGVVAPSTLILPVAAALLLGSGLLAYGIQRRRR